MRLPRRVMSAMIGGGNRPGRPPFHELNTGEPGMFRNHCEHWLELGFDTIIARMSFGQFSNGEDISATGVGWKINEELALAMGEFKDQLDFFHYEGSQQTISHIKDTESPPGPRNAYSQDVTGMSLDEWWDHQDQVLNWIFQHDFVGVIYDRAPRSPDFQKIIDKTKIYGLECVAEPDGVIYNDIEHYRIVTKDQHHPSRPTLPSLSHADQSGVRWYQLSGEWNNDSQRTIFNALNYINGLSHHAVAQSWPFD